jgi:hypothetical protein
MVTKITGNQVSLLLALFLKAGIRGNIKQLEWIEDNLDIEVKSLEEINTGQVQLVVNKLKLIYNLD